MRQNPNFASNFSDGNMTDSLKLEQYNNNEGDYNTNARNQFLKYAGGGKGQQFDIQEDREKNQVKFQIPDIKNIKTQQSQVSNQDAGFKKLKGNQVQILNQLRSEFDKIRNMPAANNPKQEQKLSSSSQQNNNSRSNHRIGDQSSSEISSQKVKQKQTINTNNRQDRLWQVQRKQFEYMLSNCQHKIQQLLHAEMEYKKIIHELRSSTTLIKTTSVSKNQTDIKDLQRQLKQEKDKNYQLTVQLQKQKLILKQQTQKITKFETESNYRFKDENKLTDEKKKLQQYLRLEKDRYMNTQIQKRKYQMQNQLLQKQKQQQVTRVQRQFQHQNILHELNIKNITKKYQDQIEIKDRRYRLLLNQFEQLKKDYATTKEQAQKQPVNNNNQMLDIFRRLLQDKKSNQNQQLSKTINNFIGKIQEREEHSQIEGQHSRLIQQIRLLKAQIEHLKNNTYEGIDLEPMKKMYEAEIAALKDTIAVLQRKLKNTPKEQTPPNQKQQQNGSKQPFSNIQVSQLQKRIAQLQLSQKNVPSNEQTQQLLEAQRRKLQQIQQQLRNQRRKSNQLQFQVSKLQKQLQFRTTIINNEKQSALRIKQSQIQRANSNVSYWRQQFDNMRRFFQLKLQQKNQLLQRSSNSVQIVTIQKSYDEGLQKIRNNYENQIKLLVQKISSFNTNSLDYDKLYKKYTQLQLAFYDLQRILYKSKQTNQTVDHLWLIKQTQYGNINQLLRQVYGKHRDLSQIHNNNIRGGQTISSQGQTVTYNTQGQTVTYNQSNPINNNVYTNQVPSTVSYVNQGQSPSSTVTYNNSNQNIDNYRQSQTSNYNINTNYNNNNNSNYNTNTYQPQRTSYISNTNTNTNTNINNQGYQQQPSFILNPNTNINNNNNTNVNSYDNTNYNRVSTSSQNYNNNNNILSSSPNMNTSTSNNFNNIPLRTSINQSQYSPSYPIYNRQSNTSSYNNNNTNTNYNTNYNSNTNINQQPLRTSYNTSQQGLRNSYNTNTNNQPTITTNNYYNDINTNTNTNTSNVQGFNNQGYNYRISNKVY